jgi:hypothetical protein
MESARPAAEEGRRPDSVKSDDAPNPSLSETLEESPETAVMPHKHPVLDMDDMGLGLVNGLDELGRPVRTWIPASPDVWPSGRGSGQLAGQGQRRNPRVELSEGLAEEEQIVTDSVFLGRIGAHLGNEKPGGGVHGWSAHGTPRLVR